MLISGNCHCGTIACTRHWDLEQTAAPARACLCSCCTRHGGARTAWSSSGASIKRRGIGQTARVAPQATGLPA
jgi:hypothetical protein